MMRQHASEKVRLLGLFVGQETKRIFARMLDQRPEIRKSINARKMTTAALLHRGQGDFFQPLMPFVTGDCPFAVKRDDGPHTELSRLFDHDLHAGGILQEGDRERDIDLGLSMPHGRPEDRPLDGVLADLRNHYLKHRIVAIADPNVVAGFLSQNPDAMTELLIAKDQGISADVALPNVEIFAVQNDAPKSMKNSPTPALFSANSGRTTTPYGRMN